MFDFQNDPKYLAARAAASEAPEQDDTASDATAATQGAEPTGQQQRATKTEESGKAAGEPEAKRDDKGPVPYARFEQVMNSNRELKQKVKEHEATKQEIAALRKQIADRDAAAARSGKTKDADDDSWMDEFLPTGERQSAADPEKTELIELLREERAQRQELQKERAKQAETAQDAENLQKVHSIVAELKKEGVPERFVLRALINGPDGGLTSDEIYEMYRDGHPEPATKESETKAPPLSRIGSPVTDRPAQKKTVDWDDAITKLRAI